VARPPAARIPKTSGVVEGCVRILRQIDRSGTTRSQSVLRMGQVSKLGLYVPSVITGILLIAGFLWERRAGHHGPVSNGILVAALLVLAVDYTIFPLFGPVNAIGFVLFPVFALVCYACAARMLLRIRRSQLRS
jgi:hypothetical protein